MTTSPLGAVGTPLGVTEPDVAAVEVPDVDAATTLNRYSSPLVRPVTVIGLAAALTTCPPPFASVRSTAVTVYPVIGEPFADAGGNDTTAERSPATASTRPGADGMPAGTTVADGADAALVPRLLVAVAVRMYSWPLVRPERIGGSTYEENASAGHVAVWLPAGSVWSCAVTVTLLTANPWLSGDAPTQTLAKPSPGVASTELGASGRAPGVAGIMLMAPAPTALVG